MSKSDKLSTEPYKGVRDFYPDDQAFFNYLTATMRAVCERSGYVEYHASILEPAELYKAKGAENEELVNEQTYTFTDRGGREVTLRPEMTPTVARMVAARRRELGFPLRLYSIPNVFRYERPQRGRLREHWQLNVDLFGSNSPYADAEIIGVAYDVMKAFGAEDDEFEIRINNRGMMDSVLDIKLGLDSEQKKSVLRILDSTGKNPNWKIDIKEKIGSERTEKLMSFFDADENLLTSWWSTEEITKYYQLFDTLNAAGISNFRPDKNLVRGFDYYTGMVFEVFDKHPDNNRSLFGGGRYDNLTALFDEEPVTGVGFGMGDVTIRDFLAVRNLIPPYVPPTHVYIAIPSSHMAPLAQNFAASLRAQGVNVAIDFGDKKLGDQIKAASKHQIPYLIVLGENEIATDTFVVRDLATGGEERLSGEQLAEFFLNL